MRLTTQKTPPPPSLWAEGVWPPRGSESMAWRNSEPVNVGDPGRSLGNESTDEQG